MWNTIDCVINCVINYTINYVGSDITPFIKCYTIWGKSFWTFSKPFSYIKGDPLNHLRLLYVPLYSLD